MGQIRSCFTTVAATVLVAAAAMLCAVDGAEAQYRRPSFLEQLFGGGGFQQPPPQYQQRPQTHSSQPQQTDSSRAPPPRKSDKSDTPPTTTVMVFGDSFADWLGYGLEDSFSDTPEVGVVRKNKTYSGLIRYEARGDLDWPNVVRDTLAKEKADYVVIMLGLSDRQAIREAARKKEETKKDEKKDAKKDDKARDDKEAKKEAADDKPAASANDDDEGEQPNIAAPERTTRAPGGSAEFRSDRWAELYSRKIDEMIAAAKSRGVPVIWVGLPSIRGTRSTSDALYLNDLFRSRAQKAGVVYVDVWDGFVDENNRYSLHGPDVEGQTRRLRAYDGVHFTSYGARKLAHYVDREIRRLMSGRGTAPIALPSGTMAPELAAPSGPAARPLAGPVVSLTAAPQNAGELAGGGRPSAADPVAAQVLVKGEPVAPPPGRADNFAWPRALPGTTPASTAPPPVAATPASASPAAARTSSNPATTETPDGRSRRSTPAATPERRASGEPHQRPPATMQQRPPQQRPAPPPPRGGGLFDIFR